MEHEGWRGPLRTFARGAGRLVRRLWVRLKDVGRRLGGMPLWRSAVVTSAAGTLLALTVGGIISPSGLVKDAAGSIYDAVTPGPSAGERAVDSLYSNVEASSLWRFPPSMSAESREFLAADWDAHRADEMRPFKRRGAAETGFSELFRDYTLDGRPVWLRGFVGQVFHITREEGEKRTLASLRLAVGGEDEVAWCGHTAFPRDEPPEVDQLVEVRAVVVARGSANTTSGGFVNGTYLVCSSVRQLSNAESAREVGDLFGDEEVNTRWMAPPSMSGRARMHLLRNWDEMNPYEVHPFPREEPRSIGIDQVYEDTRFDQELLWLAGYVTQRVLAPAGPGLTTEYVRLGVNGEENAVWCLTTLQNSRVFREDELVEGVGVPIARGSAEISSGGFQNQTAMVCPAMRRA